MWIVPLRQLALGLVTLLLYAVVRHSLRRHHPTDLTQERRGS